MSSEVNSVDFSPMFDALREGLDRFLPHSAETARVVMESSALTQISYASIKNIPYAFLSTEFGINNVCHVLSSRVTYLEATMMALLSLVHNVFFAILYTGLCMGTLGFSKELNLRCRTHWAHSGYSTVGSGLGMTGMVRPYWGVGLNIYYVIAIARSLRKSYRNDLNHFERPLLRQIKLIVKDYSSLIHNWTRIKAGDWHFKNYYQPSLWYIEKQINAAQRMDDLLTLIDEIRSQWPKVGFSDAVINSAPSTAGSPAAHHHYE